jgi:hypothetical protein
MVGSGGRRGENAQGAQALLILERRGRESLLDRMVSVQSSTDGSSEATRPAAGLMFCKPPDTNTAITAIVYEFVIITIPNVRSSSPLI